MDDATITPSQRQAKAKGKGPRLGHTKSRHGCQRCRERRVKCDETKPSCKSCRKHNVPCIYKSRKSSEAPSTNTSDICRRSFPLRQGYTEPETGATVTLVPSAGPSLPELKSRRLLELRLLHNYTTRTSTTIPATHNPDIQELWTVEVPKLALHNDALQYGLLSLSAMHLARLGAGDTVLLSEHHKYLGLALGEHRKAVGHLNMDTADAICFTSIFILYMAFASLNDRCLDPYTPPMEWLDMASGACGIFKIACHFLSKMPTDAKIGAIIKAAPDMTNADEIFHEKNREDLGFLMMRDPFGRDIQEPWDEEIQETYEKTISYIGSVRRAVLTGEHPMALLRRVLAFALYIPKRFTRLVEERQPRALVVLAHYFALAMQASDIWWIGDVPHREIEGIRKALPLEWQELMCWPLL